MNGSKKLLRLMIEADCESMAEAFDADQIDAALLALEGVKQKLLQRQEELSSAAPIPPSTKQITLDV